MLIYFSGTGNSEYVAQRIRDIVDDEILNLFDKIRKQDYSKLSSDQPWVIVAPAYAWRIPRILHEWLKNVKLEGTKDVYFVLTCGGNIGNAGKYLQKLCDLKGMNYKGTAQVIMPENYIAMYSPPTNKEAKEIINKAEKGIDKIATVIKSQEMLLQPTVTFKDKISSSIINDIFYPVFVHAKKFYVTDKCVGCKKCAQVCPLNNIDFKDKRPLWNKTCTHCMACICRCPVEAIEYGKHSQGKNRYTFPKNK